METIRRKIASSLSEASGFEPAVADEIAFHMTDWLEEYSALTKLYTAPNEFTASQCSQVVLRFLLHAPQHVVAAAEQMIGEPFENVFAKSAEAMPNAGSKDR